jgi:hypothetical protein
MARKAKKKAPKKPARKASKTVKAVKKATKKTTKKAAKKNPRKAAPKKTATKVKAVKRAKPAAKKLNQEELMSRVHSRVEGFMKKVFKAHYEKTDDGRFLVYQGSTVVQTVIRPWHADDVVVESFAYVVQDSRLTEEILKFLLRENAIIHFGAFGLGFDGTIIFGHSIAGANLDENEFNASIKSVAKIADYYDNKIVEIGGGMTAREAMKKGVF